MACISDSIAADLRRLVRPRCRGLVVGASLSVEVCFLYQGQAEPDVSTGDVPPPWGALDGFAVGGRTCLSSPFTCSWGTPKVSGRAGSSAAQHGQHAGTLSEHCPRVQGLSAQLLEAALCPGVGGPAGVPVTPAPRASGCTAQWGGEGQLHLAADDKIHVPPGTLVGKGLRPARFQRGG